jgi:hypothetical protein
MSHTDSSQHADRPEANSASRIVLAVFLFAAAFFLWTEHRAHLLGVLPYLVFLACPLIHLFMHRGHGSHGGHHES